MYNGYKNWDTWNAYLWLCNEEDVYESLRRCWSENQLRDLYMAKFGKGFDGINEDAIDWTELYDLVNEHKKI